MSLINILCFLPNNVTSFANEYFLTAMHSVDLYYYVNLNHTRSGYFMTYIKNISLILVISMEYLKITFDFLLDTFATVIFRINIDGEIYLKMKMKILIHCGIQIRQQI